MKVAILAIGNEVLCGKTINTNSSFIAKELEILGGKIVHQQVVADKLEDIVEGLRVAYSYANVVLTIGGLGPTVDDLSRDGVAMYFNETLVYDEEIYEMIVEYFRRTNREVPSNNAKQAYKFKTGLVLKNNNGTAPGLFLEKNHKVVFLLPGPPSELQAMFYESVIPYFLSEIKERHISHSYRLCGIGEAYAEEMILSLYAKYPYLNIAPYCAIDHVDYIVSTTQNYENQLREFDKEFKTIMTDYYIGDQHTNLASEVVRLLKEKQLTIAIAESCTGGLLSSEIVNVSDASSVFLEGIVTYSYDSKMRLLNVDRNRLMVHGAVSEEIAYDMANNLKELTGADVTIGVTGIAGPDGGSDLKPVGLVYIGLNICGENIIKSYIFNGNREKIRQRTVAQSLYLLYHYLKAL